MPHDVNVYETSSSSQSERSINNSNGNESFENQNGSKLTIQVFNRFHIQIELVHIEDFPNESPKRYDKICSQWNSEEFKDFPHFVQTQTNPLHDGPCNYALGLPVIRASTTNENND
ncbi:unnamed protein product [Rotaria sordida]|uniref:Uncharacterized protein n=1 Tax=Rotaria sordida TaxID=392033 RepID=A0A816CM16_9BILA|nr:unnamed protein product [Rotaria sordida]CAF1626208.1 unnamed protein product [Rotaria sordida]